MASAGILLLLQGILVVCASFISGLSGFGQAIIYQTVWTLLGTLGVEGAGNLKDGVAITFIGGLTAAFVMARESYRAKEVRWDLAVGLTPGSLVFTILGTAALTTFNQAALKKSLGILFLLFASWQLYMKCKAIVAEKQKEKFAIIAEHEQEMARAKLLEQQSQVENQQTHPSILQEPQPLEQEEMHLATDSFLTHSGENATECDLPRTRAGSEVQLSPDNVEHKSPSPIQLIEISSNDTVEHSSPTPTINLLDDPLSHSPFVCSPSLWLAQTRLLLTQREFQGALLAGSIAGFLGGCFGTNGPPIMLFFSVIPITKGQIRGTFAWNTIFLEIPKAVTLLAFGVFRADQWPIYLLMPPLTIFGTWLGGLAHHQVDVNVVMMVLQGLILLSTVALCDAFDGSTFSDCMLAVYFVIACVIGAFVLYSTSFMYRFLKQHPEYAGEFVRQHEHKIQLQREAEEASRSGRAVVAYGPAGYTEWHA